MKYKTSGKCERCHVIWQWPEGKPRLSKAACPTCGDSLVRTAARLVKNMPIKEGVAYQTESSKAEKE